MNYTILFYFVLKMEKFNQLPNEIQTHVLKEYPNFRRINKQQYTEKYLFDTLYCDLDISKKEFLTYIKNEDVTEFIIYHYEDILATVYYFNFNGYNYELLKYMLFINNEDVDEYNIQDEKDIRQAFDGWDDLVEEVLLLDNLYYDIKTVNYIVAQRGCKLQHYVKNYCIKYINNILESNVGKYADIGDMYNKIVKQLYLASSSNVIKGYNQTFFEDMLDLKFISDGDVYDEDAENYDYIINLIEYNTKLYYDDIITWLNM
jgi:hypothetical protein